MRLPDPGNPADGEAARGQIGNEPLERNRIMPGYSETGLKLIKSAHSVEDSVVTNAPDIGPKLDEDFLASVKLWRASQPQTADLDAPSFTGVLYILKDGLAVSRERLAEADMVHVENLRQFLAVRRVAKKHKTNVFDKLHATHRTIEEQFAEDDEAFELTGIQIPTSQEPTKLLRQADQALKTLKSPDFVLPESKLRSLKLDPEDLVEELESDVEVFREWNGKLRSSRREVQKSRKNVSFRQACVTVKIPRRSRSPAPASTRRDQG